jgi:shikimate kinase
MMDERRPTYERLATFSVQTAGRTPQDIAGEIVERMDNQFDETDRSRTRE